MDIHIGKSVLANKYRPKALKDIIGQDSVIKVLINAFEANKFHHAYLLYGQHGSGKCVHPDTLVLTPKGLRRISSLVPIEVGWHDIDVSVVDESGVGKSYQGYCEKNADTIKITTRDGFSLEGTKEHPVRVFDKDTYSIVWKNLEEISEGDFLAIHRKPIEDDEKDRCPQEWNFNVEEYLDNKFGNNENVECCICNKRLGNLSTHLPLHGISSKEYKNRYGVSYITSSPSLKSNFLASYNNEVVIPNEFNKELARLFGYIVSEGGYYKRKNSFSITNADRQIISDIKKILYDNFNVRVNEIKNKRTKDTVCLPIHSIKINEFLFKCGLGQISSEKSIPDVVLSWPSVLLKEFLKAYFEGDGGVEKNRGVSCCSTSKKLICDIQSVLLSMGIISSCRAVKKRATNTTNKNYCDAYVLSIYGKDVHEFQKNIGFISDGKKNKLREMVERNTNFNPNKDIVPHLQNEIVRVKNKLDVLKNGYLIINGKGVAKIPWPQNIKVDRSNHKNVTYKNIEECIKYFENIAYLLTIYGGDENIKSEMENVVLKCKSILDLNYFYSPVVSKEHGKSDVLDIAKSGEDHSFISNGIISHNTSIARILSAMINCEKGLTVEPCGTCKHCSLIFEGKHYDVEEFDAASQGKIDQIRDIKKTAFYSPIAGARKKVYIIDECLPPTAFITMVENFEGDEEEVRLSIGALVDRFIPGNETGEFVPEKPVHFVKTYNNVDMKISVNPIKRYVKLPSKKELVLIEYSGTTWSGELKVTGNHKIFCWAKKRESRADIRTWERADALNLGDELMLFNGEVARITGLKIVPDDNDFVYNIEVEAKNPQNKNYFADGVLVSNCHSLSSEGEEALLKLIEEPPDHVIFILATTDLHKMRPTILSRCQSHSFGKVYWSKIFQHLVNICGKEKVEIEEGAAKICSTMANGSVRDALQYLDKLISYSGKNKITSQLAKDLFGLADDDIYYKLMNCVVGENGKPNATEGIKIINSIITSGVNFKFFLQGLDEHLNSMLIMSTAPKAIDIFPITDSDKKRIGVTVSRLDIMKIEKMISLLRNIYQGIIFNEPVERLLDQWLIDSIVCCHLKKKE